MVQGLGFEMGGDTQQNIITVIKIGEKLFMARSAHYNNT